MNLEDLVKEFADSVVAQSQAIGMQSVPVIEYIRGQRDRFVFSPSKLGEEMSSRLVFDALVSGATRVMSERVARWWIVGSPFDWFADAGSVDELFQHIVSTPQVGDNTHRHQVVLAAFADAIVVYGDGSRQWQQGKAEDLAVLDAFVLKQMRGWRVVAFACVQ